MPKILTQQQIDDFNREGWLFLPELFSPEEVALLDVLKGLVTTVGFGFVDHRAALVAGVAAVLGHVTSPFLRGRGGKGVATALGAILGVHPLWALIVIAFDGLVISALSTQMKNYR